VGLHAERFVERARNAVAVQIRAEKHGDDLFFRSHGYFLFSVGFLYVDCVGE
jgi:hypothetical protein